MSKPKSSRREYIIRIRNTPAQEWRKYVQPCRDDAEAIAVAERLLTRSVPTAEIEIYQAERWVAKVENKGAANE